MCRGGWGDARALGICYCTDWWGGGRRRGLLRVPGARGSIDQDGGGARPGRARRTSCPLPVRAGRGTATGRGRTSINEAGRGCVAARCISSMEVINGDARGRCKAGGVWVSHINVPLAPQVPRPPSPGPMPNHVCFFAALDSQYPRTFLLPSLSLALLSLSTLCLFCFCCCTLNFRHACCG